MSRKKDALKLAEQIVAVKQKLEPLKQELVALQKQFDALLENSDDTSESEGKHQRPTTIDRLKDIFTSEPETAFNVQTLHGRLNDVNPNTIRATVGRLSKRKFITDVGRGQYKYHGNSEANQQMTQ